MLFKKLLRTVWQYKAQFISMIIMIALGIGIFAGFNMEWVSLERDVNSFMDKTAFADYRLVTISPLGFTEEDADNIKNVKGVQAVSRYISVNTDVVGTKNGLALTVTEDENVSGFIVIEGAPYDKKSEDGVWLFDKYADKNGVKIGDEITLSYKNVTITGKVKGFIESSEYLICVRDSSQLMPDFKSFGYCYISPVALKNAFGMAVYPQINVKTDLDKKEFTEKANEKLGKTTLVISKDETVSYSEAYGEIDEGKTMGSILPVLFLAIAVLTMVTTMHRIVVNEKIQIGTLKALGFKDGKITKHYTSFALFIGVLGAILGVGIGYGVAAVIMNPNGMMGTYIVMPDWTIYMPWWCILIMLGIVAVLTFIGYLSVRKTLFGTPAEVLRPYVPKKQKKLKIEKTKIWNRFSFGTKWNLRDISRHKARSVMSLIGVIGCMILLVGAVGMYDTMNAFLDVYYKDVATYSSKVFVSENATNEQAKELALRLNGDYSASVYVEMNDEACLLEVYKADKELYNFLDKNNNKTALPVDGALVCMRIAEEYGLKVGDTLTVSPYGTDEKYTLTVKGYNRSMTKSVSISEEYANTILYNGKALTESDAYVIDSIYTMVEKSDISDTIIASVQSKQDIIDSFDSFMQILYLAEAVLIIAAVVLGIVVLYNLGTMSYMERYSEMATLKVVGFKDKTIGKILISQNVWLTVIGIVLGFIAGVGVLNWLMVALASEYEMKVVIGVLTFAVSIILTFGVSLLVGLIVSKKNKKIKMAESLKGTE